MGERQNKVSGGDYLSYCVIFLMKREMCV